jgi:hypothetical protein
VEKLRPMPVLLKPHVDAEVCEPKLARVKENMGFEFINFLLVFVPSVELLLPTFCN